MSEPFYFGDPSAPLFGVLDRAPAESAVDRGVVICAPLGYENIIYYRQLGILARRLALAGRSTLRFDWPGCGDSAGDDRQPGLVAAYLASVGSAVDELRAHTGVAAVDLVGLRIGGTLAAAAAAHGADVSDLVLWAPYTSGRAYVRGMRAFDRLSYQEDEEVDPDAPEGQQASGFILAPTTIADLGGVDLTKLEYGSPRRFLLAGRDEPPDEALVSHLRGLGHEYVDGSRRAPRGRSRAGPAPGPGRGLRRHRRVARTGSAEGRAHPQTVRRGRPQIWRSRASGSMRRRSPWRMGARCSVWSQRPSTRRTTTRG